MGAKITVDSATLVNKGLEIIEAHWLFGLPYEKIDVVIHPQSIVHSVVRFIDGSMIAQMAKPDMRIPILYALAYPNRLKSDLGADVLEFPALSFARRRRASLPVLPARGGGGQGRRDRPDRVVRRQRSCSRSVSGREAPVRGDFPN